MSATAVVITKLLATAAVTAIVGQKVYPIVAPQNTTAPCIVVNVVSANDIGTHLNGAGKYFAHRMQVDCIAATATGANNLGEAVMAALNGVIKEAFASCQDIDILFAGVDETDFADDRTIFRRFIQFRVHWRAA